MNSQRTKQNICKPRKPTHDQSLQKSCFLADALPDIKIQKKNIDDFSVVIESIAMVQKKSVNGTNIEQLVDKKEGNFNSSVTAIDLVSSSKQIPVKLKLFSSVKIIEPL